MAAAILGDLISRQASCLDAFSIYLFRTSLPSYATGVTTRLKSPAPTPDRDRTVSRRSEPSSRTAVIGEQPNPCDLLQPQDAMSRHRGAKPKRRCELLGVISLLSPEYLLSDERWPFHSVPPDHYDLLSHLLDLSVSQSSSLLPLHSTVGFQST